MPSVADVLRSSGFTEEQIKGLDAKVVSAFDGVLSTAQGEREAAELALRSNRDFYESQIAPSLNTWQEEKMQIENEKARAMAEAAFYRTQAEAGKQAGFVPAEAPTFNGEGGGAQGGYRAGAQGGTPGSPAYFDVSKVYERAGDAVGVLTDIQWEHQRLFGAPMPISPTELIRQADAQRLDPKVYAAKAFSWDSRRAELQKKSEEEHDAGIRKQAEAARDAYWAERTGSNPDIRRPVDSKYSDLRRAVSTKDLPDPLALNDAERRKVTATMIRADIAGRNDAA